MSSSIPDAPTLVLDLPGGATQEFTLSKAAVVIGRATTSDIVVREWNVSRNHARVERTPDGFEIVDLGSLNGTLVNGRRQTRSPLTPGDLLTLGGATFRFDPSRAEAANVTQVSAPPDPNATLAGISLPVNLEESTFARVAVHTAEKTWEVAMTGDALTIGRDSPNDIVLDTPAVSRRHAVIERSGAGFVIRDLQSRNGTWLRRERVSDAALNDGDTVVIGTAQLVFKSAVSPEGLAADEDAPRATGRRPVVVIPGFAGSNLWLGSEQIWPTLRMHEIADLLNMRHALEPKGIVDEVVIVPNLIRLDQYGVLTGYLREALGYEAGKDLLEFAYDFRQDNRDSARRLAAALEDWNPSTPITIIAHSMGSLVARYYVERLGGKKRVERLILLGGPHAGTPYAVASLLKGPDLLPLGFMNLRLRDAIATFPSWYQILPTYECVTCQSAPLHVLRDDWWLQEAQRLLLRQAAAFRAELASKPAVPTICVFGYGFDTVTSAALDRDSRGSLRDANFTIAKAGDGTIPESSAVMKHAEIHPVRQHHGALYVDNDVKMRLKLELTRP